MLYNKHTLRGLMRHGPIRMENTKNYLDTLGLGDENIWHREHPAS